MPAAVSASLVLAACSGSGETAPSETEAEPDAPQASSGVMQPGLYAVGDGTQVYSRTRLSEDGTYTDLNDAMEPVGGGTWAERDELICFDPEGDGGDRQERCWTVSPPDENGVIMSARIDSDEKYAITPIEE